MESLESITNITIPQNVLYQEVGGELVLLNMDNGEYFGLNEVGNFIWTCIGEGLLPADILEKLGEEYETTREQLQSDLEELLKILEKHGLINIQTE